MTMQVLTSRFEKVNPRISAWTSPPEQGDSDVLLYIGGTTLFFAVNAEGLEDARALNAKLGEVVAAIEREVEKKAVTA